MNPALAPHPKTLPISRSRPLARTLRTHSTRRVVPGRRPTCPAVTNHVLRRGELSEREEITRDAPGA